MTFTANLVPQVLTSRKNRGSPLTLKLIDVFGKNLEELRAELEPLCHCKFDLFHFHPRSIHVPVALVIQHDGNSY